MAVYLGYDVLEIEPNATVQREHTYTRSLARLDSRAGKLRVSDRSGVAVVEPTGFGWLMEGRTEIQAYLDFLAAQKGSLVPFWFPSWQHDLVMSVDLAALSVSLVVVKMGYTQFMFSHPARRHLAFLLDDGTKHYRKVIGTAEGAQTETLTLDSSISVLVPALSTMLGFLRLVRLAVDDPELVWHTREVAETTLDFVELPQEAPA